MFEVNDKDARKTSLRFQRVSIVEFEQDNVCWEEAVFLTQIISRQQKNADAKVALSISRRKKWKSRRQFSKSCIFPNLQLKGVANKLLQFKNLFDRTNRF